MTLIEGALPPCQQCGELLSASNGQHLMWTTTMTIDADGEVVSVEEHSGWCGACTEAWNEAMGKPSSAA